jgi:anti-sigma-K factor RskA
LGPWLILVAVYGRRLDLCYCRELRSGVYEGKENELDPSRTYHSRNNKRKSRIITHISNMTENRRHNRPFSLSLFASRRSWRWVFVALDAIISVALGLLLEGTYHSRNNKRKSRIITHISNMTENRRHNSPSTNTSKLCCS